MKTLFFACIGMILALVGFTVVYSQYTDYRGETIVRHWVKETAGLRAEIEKAFNQTGALPPATHFIKPKPKFADRLELFDHGVMVVEHQTKGYLLVVFPEIKNQRLIWHCYASPQKTARQDDRHCGLVTNVY